MTNDNSWHLDKRVPIGFIIVLLTQTVALVWWAATMTSRMENIETALQDHTGVPAHGSVATQLASLVARQDLILQRQNQIIATVDRINEKVGNGVRP